MWAATSSGSSARAASRAARASLMADLLFDVGLAPPGPVAGGVLVVGEDGGAGVLQGGDAAACQGVVTEVQPLQGGDVRRAGQQQGADVGDRPVPQVEHLEAPEDVGADDQADGLVALLQVAQ